MEFCGEFPPHSASTEFLDSILFDRFGNTYDRLFENDSLPQPLVILECPASQRFNITFSAEITQAAKDVVCEVLSYIENEISGSPNMPFACGDVPEQSKIEILITEDPGLLLSSTLASASAFYYLDNDSECANLKTNIVREKYLTGFSSKNGAYDDEFNNPIGFDGRIRIRPNDPANPIYSFENAGPPVGSSLFDFYSIILHEFTHLLGFASSITNDFSLNLSNTSIWDTKLLHIENGNINHLIINDCSQDCYNFNSPLLPPFGDLSFYLADVCGGTSPSIYAPGGQTFIYPPYGTLNLVNYFSHIGVDCNDSGTTAAQNDYIMFPFLEPELVKRIYSNEELLIMCELGYGTSECEGECFVFANDEYGRKNNEGYVDGQVYKCCSDTYFICEGEETFISSVNLLCNEFSSEMSEITSYEVDPLFEDIITIVQVPGGINITATEQPVDANYLYVDEIKIYYTVKSCDCTILTTYFNVDVGICNSCKGDEDPCIQLNCLSDFENFAEGRMNAMGTDGLVFVNEGSDQNSADILIDLASDNKFLAIGGAPPASSGSMSSGPEVVSMNLLNPIRKGCRVNFTFDGGGGGDGVELLILGSTFAPCDPQDQLMPSILDCGAAFNCNGSDFFNCIAELPIDYTDISISPPWPFVTGPINIYQYDYTVEYLGETDINYLYLTSDGGWVFLDNIIITQNCARAEFDVFLVDCDTYQFKPVYPMDENTYLWDFGDGNNSSELNPEHIYAQNGSYDVHLTVVDECGNVDDQWQTIIVNCPPPPSCDECVFGPLENSTFLDCSGGVTVSSLIASGDLQVSTLFGQTLVGNFGFVTNFIVCGDLLVDIPITILNAHFKMETGAGITVVSGGVLRNLYSRYEGCRSMWKGIKVEKENIYSGNYAIIEDAEYALNLDAGAIVDFLYGNTFKDNYISINAGGNSFSSYNSFFTSEGDLKPSYMGQIGYPDPNAIYPIPLRPFLAIQATESNVLSQGSTIRGHRNGIHTDNQSTLDIVGGSMSDFTDARFINASNITLISESGYGIVADENVILKVDNLTINDCSKAILAVDNITTDISISSCDISNLVIPLPGPSQYMPTPEAIKIKEGTNTSILIDNNDISESYNGIDVSLINSPEAIDITNNSYSQTINAGNIILRAIRVHNSDADADKPIIISNNLAVNIENQTGLLSGIVISSDHAFVEDNTINYLNCTKSKGIDNYSSTSYFRNNTISLPANTTGSNHTGIQSQQSIGSSYCCNSVANGKYGFRFVLDNSDSEFRSNQMISNANAGLYIYNYYNATTGDQIGGIGSQNLVGNTWSGSNSIAQLDVSFGGDLNQAAFASTFFVNDGQSGTKPNDFIPMSIENDWFQPISGFAQFCSNPNYGNCGIPEFDFNGGSGGAGSSSPLLVNNCNQSSIQGLVAIATGYLNHPQNTDFGQWTRNMYLLNMLNQYPALLNACISLNAFYQANQTGILHDYDATVEQLSYYVSLSASDIQSIQTSQDIIKTKIDLIATLETYLNTRELTRSEINLIQTWMAEIETERMLIATIVDNHKAHILNDYNSMYQSINLLTANKDHLQVAKNMLFIKLAITRYGIDGLSNAQWDMIDDIANLCPYEVGKSVYLARMINEERGVFFDESYDPCATSNKRIAKQEDIQSDLAINIYPNPTNGLVNLDMKGLEDLPVSISIMDINGREMLRQECFESSTTLDLTAYKSGIYVCRVYQGNEILLTNRIILMK